MKALEFFYLFIFFTHEILLKQYYHSSFEGCLDDILFHLYSGRWWCTFAFPTMQVWERTRKWSRFLLWSQVCLAPLPQRKADACLCSHIQHDVHARRSSCSCSTGDILVPLDPTAICFYRNLMCSSLPAASAVNQVKLRVSSFERIHKKFKSKLEVLQSDPRSVFCKF